LFDGGDFRTLRHLPGHVFPTHPNIMTNPIAKNITLIGTLTTKINIRIQLQSTITHALMIPSMA
jgi:hypothetical protein